MLARYSGMKRHNRLPIFMLIRWMIVCIENGLEPDEEYA